MYDLHTGRSSSDQSNTTKKEESISSLVNRNDDGNDMNNLKDKFKEKELTVSGVRETIDKNEARRKHTSFLGVISTQVPRT
jgi:hypothetical protein